MPDITLAATARTEFGKGAARRTRRAGRIPAVLYGHGQDPLHISLPSHDTFLALKHANALFSIELDGSSQLAIVKDVQRDYVRNEIEHVDLLAVRKGEKVAVEVQVSVVGESEPGTIHVVELQTLHIEAEATSLPESIEISVEGLTAGSLVLAGDIELPEGATLLTDPEAAVVGVEAPRAEVEEVAETVTVETPAEED